jgi:hypothetical protein
MILTSYVWSYEVIGAEPMPAGPPPSPASPYPQWPPPPPCPPAKCGVGHGVGAGRNWGGSPNETGVATATPEDCASLCAAHE